MTSALFQAHTSSPPSISRSKHVLGTPRSPFASPREAFRPGIKRMGSPRTLSPLCARFSAALSAPRATLGFGIAPVGALLLLDQRAARLYSTLSVLGYCTTSLTAQSRADEDPSLSALAIRGSSSRLQHCLPSERWDTRPVPPRYVRCAATSYLVFCAT